MSDSECGEHLPAEQLEQEHQLVERYRRQRRNLRIRRLIAVGLVVSAAYGVFFLVFGSGVADPVLAHLGSAKNFVNWIIEDPGRAWTSAAVLLISHIGLYFFFFEDH